MEERSDKLIAVLAGSTGLVGDHCLQHLISSEKYREIRVISRRPLRHKSEKIKTFIVEDFEDITLQKDLFKNADSVFCCLGTTIKKAGSKDEFYKVDHDYVMILGQLAEENDVQKFLLVSAVGVNPDSSVFYNRVKGEMERDVEKLNIPSIAIFKPSMLYGERNEFRLGEKIGIAFMKIISPLFSKNSKFKGIESEDVANAMVNKSLRNFKGISYLHYSDMQKLISKRTS